MNCVQSFLLVIAAAAFADEACDAAAASATLPDGVADSLFHIDGRSYPEWVRHNGKKLLLTGGGTRYKYGVAKIYALGLYIEEAALSGSLAAWAGATEKSLAKDGSFSELLAMGSFAKTLGLHFHRSVDGATIAEAIKDSLTSRLEPAAVASFHRALIGALAAGVDIGTQLYFSCRPDEIQVSVDALANVVATVREPSVCEALFEVYYGAAPVAPSAKAGMISGFVKLVSGSAL